MVYKIPIAWQSYRVYNAEADNLQDAIIAALKEFLSTPDEEYLQDSFEIDGILEDNYPDEEYNITEIMEKI